MLDRIRNLFAGGGDPPTDRLPGELVAAITAASIVFRPGTDEDGASRVHVVVATVGSFRFDGINEAADRIGRAWPEISAPPSTAGRASSGG